MTLHFYSKGPITQVSGGYLYNRYLLEFLRREGLEVRYHADANALEPIRERDRVVVDGLVIAELAHALLDLAVEPILLIHLAPDVYRIGESGSDLDRQTLQRIYRRSTVVVTGDASALGVSKVCRLDADKLVTIEPAVPDGWQAKTSYADRAGTLLCVANYVEGKGYDLLLEALRGLKHIGWSLDAYGNQQLDPVTFSKISDKIVACGLSAKATLHGPVAHREINRLMVQADLLVHFSAYESYSMVTLEAIASGLPVLSFKTGNAREFTRSGLVAYLEHRTVGAARSALEDLMNGTRAYADLRPKGRPKMRSWEQVGREFLRLLQR